MTFMDAPGTTPAVVSLIVPAIEPLLVCAATAPVRIAMARAKRNPLKTLFPFMYPPFVSYHGAL